jgi:hypothetical protein
MAKARSRADGRGSWVGGTVQAALSLWAYATLLITQLRPWRSVPKTALACRRIRRGAIALASFVAQPEAQGF